MADISEYIKSDKKAHLVGIGGVSMYSLAESLLDKGKKITGSDIHESENVKRLEEKGVKIFMGHFPENISGADYVIRTAAAKNDNPEIAAAIRAGIPVFERAQAWGALMKDYKHAVCVAGTHGKTTTTSMITSIALVAGRDPSVMIGGEYSPIGGGHRVGRGDTIILEACEYKDSFLNFSPTIAVILNVDCDHVDYFDGIEAVSASFRKFAELVPENGIIIANGDDANTVKCLENLSRRVVFFGTGENASVKATNITLEKGLASFDLIIDGEKAENIHLVVPGRHNVLNALAASGAAFAFGVDNADIKKGLEAFIGVGRRFEYRGLCGDAPVYDDYAHHPNELKALFDSALSMGYDRVICAFQPHTYSRTKAFFDDFVTQLSRLNLVVLADIYAAREQNTIGISSADLSAKIKNSVYLQSFDEIVTFIKKAARPGDIILTVGAGELNIVAGRLCEKP